MNPFFKKQVGDMSSFELPQNKWDRTVVPFDSLTMAQINQHLNEHTEHNIHLHKDIGIQVNKIVKKTDTTKLPFGTYIHHMGSYPQVERLVPSSTRESEAYMNISSLDSLNQDLELFLNSKDLYKELGFSYRRGYLLYGSPGNGKTSLIREFVKKYQDKFHIIWCDGVPSREFIEAFNKIDSMKIVIFEELVNKSDSMYFDMGEFLDMMDGEGSLKNCITIATTNYPHKLEENLANRPSRFDIFFEVKNPSVKQAYTILSKFLGREVSTDEVDLKDLSFAQLKEMVLLHKMFKISLKETQARLIDHTKRFENGFEEKKAFGI